MKQTLVLLSLIAVLSLRAADAIRPDPKLTPGAVFTNVTVEQITQKGYANVINGGVRNVPDSVRRHVYISYFGKVPEKAGGHYELDHLISLELGGSNDPQNLWPESYRTFPYEARTKDKLENRMAKLVREELKAHGHDAATSLLKKFQHEIATDWIAAYKKYVSPKP